MFFGYNGINRKMIYIVLMVLMVFSLLSMGTSAWINILLTLPAVILAISFHEFAHAFMADRFGDKTPRSQGRLTLNPIKHLDFFGFVLMVFAHIGWGKPVQINPNNFTSNKSRKFSESMVSLGGPLMTFILAIIGMALYILFINNVSVTSNLLLCLQYFIQIFITVNIGLGVFNLIPLPPLDGEKIFKNLLPYKVQSWLDGNYQTLYIIFMILWIFGFLEIIVSPIINVVYNALFYAVASVMGLFM